MNEVSVGNEEKHQRATGWLNRGGAKYLQEWAEPLTLCSRYNTAERLTAKAWFFWTCKSYSLWREGRGGDKEEPLSCKLE
jgi:hypothetical protein